MSVQGVNTPGYVPSPGLQEMAPPAHSTGTTSHEIDASAYVCQSAPDQLPGASRNPLPEAKGAPGASSATLDRLCGLNEDQVSTDIYSFMALFQKLAQETRDTARLQRAATAQQQVDALANAADEMRNAAADRFKAGIAQGISQVVSGAVQMGTSAFALHRNKQAATSEKNGTDLLNESKTLKPSDPNKQLLREQSAAQTETGKKYAGSATFFSAVGTGAGGFLGGIGGCIAAHYTRQADEADAARAGYDAQAKVAETGHQQANDAMQQMMDIIRDVREKLQSIQQAAVETNRGIARNI